MAGLAAWLAVAAVPARAETAPLDRLVDLAATDATLASVAAQLSADTGAKVVAHPGVAAMRVTLDLHGVTLRTALQVIAEMAGLTVGIVDDAIVLRNPADRIEGAFRPVPPPPVVPGHDEPLKKVRYVCQNLLPSQVAAFFGRPAIHRTGESGGLEPAPPFPAVLDQTALVLHEGESASDRAVCESMLASEAKRLAERWAVGPGQAGEHGGAGIEAPLGVIAIIGYDPGRSLIGLGTPAAMETFALMAAQLDSKAARVTLNAHYYVVPADKLAHLGLDFATIETQAGTGQFNCAKADAVTAAAALSGAAGKAVFDAKPVTVDNARPAVLSCSRRLAAGVAADSCFSTPLLAADVAQVLATSDLRVVPWAANGGYAVQVEAAYGDVLVDLKRSGANQAAKTTEVPCNSTNFALAAGQSLVLAGVGPKAGLRADEACRLLGGLPLFGDFYRGAKDPAPESVVVLLLTPSAAN
jgi:hypothetical protein